MNIHFSISAGSTANSQQNFDDTSIMNVQQDITKTKSISTISVDSKESGSIGHEHLIRNIERAMKVLEGPQTTLEISIHERTHDIMVKVLNKETGELIREIPPEKTLDIVAKMMEIAGILVDKKV